MDSVYILLSATVLRFLQVKGQDGRNACYTHTLTVVRKENNKKNNNNNKGTFNYD